MQADFDEQSPEFAIVLHALFVASTIVYVDAVKKFYFHGHDLSFAVIVKGILLQWRVSVGFVIRVLMYKVRQYVDKIRD